MNLLSGEEVKRKEVEILNHIVAMCEKHGLRYYLSYGTLLGAIRHKGFIPWDDDIDISMPRADYEQLLKVMLANPDKRFVALTPKSKGYPYHYAKVVDLSTKLVEEDLDDFAGNGLWVDIFPLDGVDTTEPTRQKELAKYFNSRIGIVQALPCQQQAMEMAHLQNDWHTQFLTVGDLGEPPIAFRQCAIRGTHAHRHAIPVSSPPVRQGDKSGI